MIDCFPLFIIDLDFIANIINFAIIALIVFLVFESYLEQVVEDKTKALTDCIP